MSLMLEDDNDDDLYDLTTIMHACIVSSALCILSTYYNQIESLMLEDKLWRKPSRRFMVQITIQKRSSHSDDSRRKFFKKTARGKVIKGKHSARLISGLTSLSVLRERYLRDDISCGISTCSLCNEQQEHILPPNGDKSHTAFPNGHFLIPDTNAFLHQVRLPISTLHSLMARQMDLIEHSSFSPPIILLQTVMDEVRHRSLPLHNRLKALLKMDEKRVWVFYNEYSS